MGKQHWKPGNMLNPVPAVMVSVTDKDGRSNIITVAWAGTVCTNPPMVSISVRPSRYSYKMIEDTGEFVINLTNESLVKACDYCGVVSGRDVDKFKKTGLTPIPMEHVRAMGIGESPVNMECRVTEKRELGSHTMFIASVEDMDVLTSEPSATYAYYQSSIKPKPEKPAAQGKTIWRCTVCGYIYEGEELPEDFICPLCKHPASDFEKVTQ